MLRAGRRPSVHLRPSWFGIPRRLWWRLAAVLTILIAIALLADPAIDRLSRDRAIMSGRVVRCGEPGRPVSALARRIAVVLDDGRLINATRYQSGRPHCAERVMIIERITPWGSARYELGRRQMIHNQK